MHEQYSFALAKSKQLGGEKYWIGGSNTEDLTSWELFLVREDIRSLVKNGPHVFEEEELVVLKVVLNE